jgi:hypothetical protein
MNGTQGDLVTAERRKTGGHRHRRAANEDDEIIDYTRAAMALDNQLTFGQAVAQHAAEVVATPAVPAPIAAQVDTGLLRARLEAAEQKITALQQRVDVLESGMSLMLRRLTPHGIHLEELHEHT